MRDLRWVGVSMLGLACSNCTTGNEPGGTGFATTAAESTSTSNETTGGGESTESTTSGTDETTTETDSESTDTGEGEGPQVLAMDAPGARGIAVDATHVYWTNTTSGTIQRVEIAGGEAELLADEQVGPYAITLDSTHAYWSNQAGDAIMRVPKAGGAAEKIDNAYDPTGIAVDDTQVYWLSTIGVFKAPKEGGNGTMLSANEGTLGGIALSTSHVYWTDHAGWDEVPDDTSGFVPPPDDDPFLEGRVLRISKAGGSAQVVVGAQEFPFGIDTDSQYVYWANNTAMGDFTEVNKIKRAPLQGGSDEDLATMQDQPWAIVTLGDWVYYGTWTQVWKVPRTGGAPALLADMQYLPRFLAVDNAHLFWTNGDGAIMKLAFE